jgi:hypothetical protein
VQEKIQMRRLALFLIAGVVAVLLSGCKGDEPAAIQPSSQALTADPTPYLASGGSAVLQPESGGVLMLAGGAEVSVPPEALSQATLVSLRAANSHPTIPVPRSGLGPAYELSLDGASLNGLAVLTLPLPQGITAQEYDVGAYRWNDHTWERVSGQLAEDKIRIATKEPGLFALQGTWKLATAALGLALPPDGLQPGMSSIPFALTGRYRFAALPALQRGYTPVRLALKRDSSGGAGQITGDVTLDETVAETTVWFQPDPGQAQGEIQFEHVFEIPPGELDVMPGTTSRYYAVFQAEDSSAPTSQLSTAVDYTHILPIQIVGREVVRPEVSSKTGRPLQWHIRLNGETWMEIPADRTLLPIEDVLAEGGIGDYRITLETQSEGKWVTASNEVSVTLAPPPTETPIWTETPPGTQGPGELPGIATPTPSGPMPPTPTRRPRPQLTPDLSPTPTASVVPTATSTRQVGSQEFWADSYSLAPGDCTNLHWNVQNVTEVYLDGQPVTGAESRRVCPTQPTTYVLRTVATTGSQERRVTISVGAQGTALFEFTADDYQLTQGACTVLRWRAQGVAAVYLNGEGVAGEDTRSVCPPATTTYTLRVVSGDNTSSYQSLTIAVVEGSGIPIDFWADQYTLHEDECTNLYWAVEGVQAVYFGEAGSEEGVSGSGMRRVCPVGDVVYTLRIATTDGTSESKQLILHGAEPSLGSNEVIAQAVVRNVVRTADVDSDAGGQQAGWNIVVDGINVLFSGETSCCQASMTLRVPEDLVEKQAVFGVPIDWPINSGQGVEFRAICTASSCRLDAGPPMYLRVRSQ